MSVLQHSLRLTALAVVAMLAAAPSPGRAAGCPSEVLYEPTAGATLDAGWSGLAHHEPIFGTTLHLSVSCGSTGPPCGSCAITGVAPIAAGQRLRCRTDTSIACTIASEVDHCGAPDTCRYHLSAPQPLGAGGIPFCVVTELDGAVTGSVDVESGAFAPIVPLRATVYDGFFVPPFTGPNQGCPRCVGDPAPNDDVHGGTCDVGPRAGLTCDANGVSPYADFGSTSFDCPPAGAPVAEFRNTIPFSTTPQIWTLTAASPPCTGTGPPPPDRRCFCSTCNDAAGEPCSTNADCPTSGGNPGVCGGKRCLGGSNGGNPCEQTSECPAGGACGRPGEATKPHACLDDTSSPIECMYDADDYGICAPGPVSSTCSNHPNRDCLNDANCDGVPGSCETVLRSCYPDNGMIGAGVSVNAIATAPVANVAEPTDLGGLTCLAPTSDVFIDVWGLPGLARIHQPGRLVFGDLLAEPELCPTEPAVCRTPLVPAKSSLELIDRSADDKDRLAWKWLKGEATTVADFGDPLATDAYALCLYDAMELRAAMAIPAGGTCAGKPCWQQKSNGFVYRNKNATPSGLTQLVLKAGVAEKAQIHLKGKGVALPTPPLPSLSSTLQVQIRNRTSGLCWSATYVPPFDVANAERLKGRAD
jgi:hypothetical protein